MLNTCGMMINYYFQLFDDRWHKIMLGVTENRAKLWVDCQPIKSVDGYIESPLRTRGHYDINDGFLSIAQHANQPRQAYQVTISREFVTFLLIFSLSPQQQSSPVSVNFSRNLIFFLGRICSL